MPWQIVFMQNSQKISLGNRFSFRKVLILKYGMLWITMKSCYIIMYIFALGSSERMSRFLWKIWIHWSMSVSIATPQTCRSIDYTISVIHPSNDSCRVFTSPGCCRLPWPLSFSCSRAQTLGWSKLVCGQNALTVSRYSTSPVVSSCCHRWVLPLSLSCSFRGIYAKKTRVYCVKEMTESRVSPVVRFKIRSLCLNINRRHCIECNEIHRYPCDGPLWTFSSVSSQVIYWFFLTLIYLK